MATAPDLEFEIITWLDPNTDAGPALASLRIVGPDGRPITEVEDTIARTVRTHVNVPIDELAHWLMVNWWRLRWEPRPVAPDSEWLLAHSMAGISGAYAWPPVEFSSDGESIQGSLSAEDTADVAAIRYLRSATVNIEALQFEGAIDRLINSVETRISLCSPIGGSCQISEPSCGRNAPIPNAPRVAGEKRLPASIPDRPLTNGSRDLPGFFGPADY